ncbi:hypothetical protein ACJMK2_015863 [Sinanodonta woodiana]|uniref:Store-operated calcium entry regulator STIMATE-like n=1 Tax=Sinanodonta woodiana TaxID=1069815 RepID=A0ABD3URS2_SINWO
MAFNNMSTASPLAANISQKAMTAPEPEGFHCNTGYLMGPLGLFLQGLLAFLAFTSLIAKRFCEPKYERRPWRIWFYDTSKQGFGAAVIHFANVFLADVFQGDPCTWYVVSFLLDSTIGLFIIYLGLKITQVIAHRKGWETLFFGEYGSPPQCNAYVGQCGLYILVMIVEKLFMTFLIQFKFWENVRKFIMAPVKDPKLELVIVMFIVPLVVNAFIFWVVDNFLKRKNKTTKTLYVNNDDHTAVKYYRSSGGAMQYNKIDKGEDGDSDIIISTDDDVETRLRRTSEGTELLIS